jgi:uncharacterized membrane protein
MSRTISEERAALLIGRLVQIMVFVAAIITFAGGVAYLVNHGFTVSDYRRFHGEPQSLRGLTAIIHNAASFNASGLIQLGVLVLIAIPALRVIAYGIVFLARRDWLYSSITLIVLCILIFSLLSGSMAG